jgi:hypothetical protein
MRDTAVHKNALIDCEVVAIGALQDTPHWGVSVICICTLHVYIYIYKVKVKVEVKFTLEQATKTQRGSTGIALLFP